MKSFLWVLLVSILAVMFIACGGIEEQSNIANTNSPATNEKKPNEELKAAIFALEKDAHEAGKNKDEKFFDDFLTGGFVGVGSRGVGRKPDAMKSITESKCETKSFTLSDEALVELEEGIMLLTSKLTSDTMCVGKAAPSPTWAATIYVKTGDKWHAAFHQTIPASDAKGESPKPAAGEEQIKQAADVNTDLSETLAAVEKTLWEAWTKKDGKVFEETLASGHVSLIPTGRNDRAAEIKSITENKCEVKSFSIDETRSVKISETISLLTYLANTDGTCDGKDIPEKSWTSTVFVKDGDKWKPTFHTSTPGF